MEVKLSRPWFVSPLPSVFSLADDAYVVVWNEFQVKMNLNWFDFYLFQMYTIILK